MKKSLNGEWLFKNTKASSWKKATVPGCNFLDLMDNGDIQDPFYSTNEKDVQWVGKEDWEYKKTFFINDNELLYDDILLECKMLDTICDVFVNSKLLFRGKNCFKAYTYSAKSLLVSGENSIRIVFHSPVNYVSDIYNKESAPLNSNGQNGIVHIRKPQCHFGWDWGPVLPLSGICDDITLHFVKSANINSVSIKQKVNDNYADISVDADINVYNNDFDCLIKITSPDGSVAEKHGLSADFHINEPELWWTYELSQKEKQPLYTVETILTVNGEETERNVKKVGIRTIELNTDVDEYGKNFQFILNGVKIFAKGSNVIPFDSFVTRFNTDKKRYFLEAARFSNMNLLRIWGGGYYADDEFLDMCDEMGILIWQDFQFACQAYPFFKNDFLSNVLDEIEYNVKRISHHPSLAVWNGNNEIEDMHMAWVYMTDYVEWTEKFFYHILKDKMNELDPSTPYLPGSPSGISHNKGVYSDNVGDTHLWGVWHGLQPMNYYRRRMTRFCSEFGFESLPDLKTIKSFAQPKDYILSGKVFNSHQKCPNGNDKMIYYIATRFNLPEKFEDYVYLSQITQQECIADATEHWRRNKGRCNGSLYWQFNDCWGVCSWSGIDYFGNYKALQYAARRFNAPLSVSIEDTDEYIKIFVLNDYNESKNIDVEYSIFDFTFGNLESSKASLNINAVENSEVFNLNVRDIKTRYNLKTTGICARLYSNNKLVMQKVVLLDKENKLNLPKAVLKTKITIENEKLKINIKSDSFARLICIQSDLSCLPFSDNYFDLLPGQMVTVTMPFDKKYTPRQLAESISVFSLCDIKPSKNKIKNQWLKKRVFLSPVNIANAIHHGRGNTDVEIN